MCNEGARLRETYDDAVTAYVLSVHTMSEAMHLNFDELRRRTMEAQHACAEDGRRLVRHLHAHGCGASQRMFAVGSMKTA